MKLSTDTVSILKNFASINQGMLFKQGNTLKTVSPEKTILAEATIEESFPQEFAIYDLNKLLAILSLHKDDVELEFDDKHVLIIGLKGRSKIKYRFTDPTMIKTPPDKVLSLPSKDIEFNLDESDFNWLMRTSSILQLPNIAVVSDGKEVNIVTYDEKNDSENTDSLKLEGVGPTDPFKMVFRVDNISKLLPGGYEVSISQKNISFFRNVTRMKELSYFVSLEKETKYG